MKQTLRFLCETHQFDLCLPQGTPNLYFTPHGVEKIRGHCSRILQWYDKNNIEPRQLGSSEFITKVRHHSHEG